MSSSSDAAGYSDQWVNYTVPSLPIDFVFTFKLSKSIGFGVYAIADFSKEYTYSAYMIKLSVGNMATGH